MTPLATAIDWAERGFRVFPVRSYSSDGGREAKQPHIKGWQHNATFDLNQIESWWAQWPDAAVGLPCGDNAGLTVIDCDIDRNTGECTGTSELSRIYPNWQDFPHCRTPSGGVHVFFAFRAGLKNNVGALPGIDIRTTGGYVIAPGSKIDAGQYEWIRRPDSWAEFPLMPRLICEALSRPEKLPQAQAETLAREDVLNSPRARTALQNELEILSAATPGGRNDQLNKSAFNLGQLICMEGHVTGDERVYCAGRQCSLRNGLCRSKAAADQSGGPCGHCRTCQ